uniref:Uncharacterized protein n=1 Tax=Opuntia streptacantha TaxID=393608 RepID=A0A7C9E7S1_OPUST
MASLASETRASFAALMTSFGTIGFPPPSSRQGTTFTRCTFLLASLLCNWSMYFSCRVMFLTFFRTGGLVRGLLFALENLDRHFLWPDEDPFRPLEEDPGLPSRCSGVDSNAFS